MQIYLTNMFENDGDVKSMHIASNSPLVAIHLWVEVMQYKTLQSVGKELNSVAENAQ